MDFSHVMIDSLVFIKCCSTLDAFSAQICFQEREVYSHNLLMSGLLCLLLTRQYQGIIMLAGLAIAIKTAKDGSIEFSFPGKGNNSYLSSKKCRFSSVFNSLQWPNTAKKPERCHKTFFIALAHHKRNYLPYTHGSGNT